MTTDDGVRQKRAGGSTTTMMMIPRRRRRRHDAGQEKAATTTGSSSTTTTTRRRAVFSIMRFVLIQTSVIAVLVILLFALFPVHHSALALSFQPSTRPRTATTRKMNSNSRYSTRIPSARRFIARRASLQPLFDDDHCDDHGDDDSLLIDGPEKSLMTNYISQFLLREVAKQQQQQQQQVAPMSASQSEFLESEKSRSSASEISRSDNADDDQDQDESSSSSYSYYTHLVAIPLDNCHELLLELESIQRAILYHCPVLVHACIPQAITRLPLLYVRCCATSASSASIAGAGGGTGASSTTDTQRLGVMVQEVIQKHGLLINKQKQNSTSTMTTEEKHNNGQVLIVDDNKDLPSDFNRVKSNHDNEKNGIIATVQEATTPLMLNFSTLEVDGKNTNQVLQTVAKETDASTRLLQQVVYDLQHLIQQQEPSWQTMLPPDPHRHQQHQTNSCQHDDDAAAVFRPRIPFMRLPQDWDAIIRQQYKREKKQMTKGLNSDNDDGDDDEDDDQVFLTSDQGGNGISPIFGGQWWHDKFPESRMREVAIYRRQQQKQQQQKQQQQLKKAKDTAAAAGLDEQSFYMPEQSIPLPIGSDALTKKEIKFQDYQEQRMLEAEGALQAQRPQYDGDENDYDDIIQQAEKRQDENDPLFVKTRNRLESLYQQSPSSWIDSNLTPPTTKHGSDESEQSIMQAQVVNRIDNDIVMDAPPLLSENQPPKPKPASDDDSNNSILDEWTRERIRKTVASRAKVQSEKELSRKKDNLPPIAENSVFTKYKEGTLVPEQDKIKQEISVTRELPPFPSREHCLGFWRVLKSPTGFHVEHDDCDPTRSDNLVLCVDGTIAGGPILDLETRQKASGGTWRLSVTSSASNDENEATLRIRLVIPPKKDRILVMQGKLSRLSSSLSGSSFSMPSSTFSIPALEEKKAKANQESEIVTCKGEVWLEDAVTGYNRNDVGTFSLMKLETPSDPKAYTITIPRPVRNQD